MDQAIEVELSEQVLEQIRRFRGELTVSQFLEKAAWRQVRKERDERDIAIYAKYEKEFAQEALEALELQGTFGSMTRSTDRL